MPIPERPNLMTALWCSTGPYALPGASLAWSDITHTYIHEKLRYHKPFTLSFLTQHTLYCPHTLSSVSGELECLFAEECCCHIQFGHSADPSSLYLNPLFVYQGVREHVVCECGGHGGRQTYRKSWKHSWA